MHTSRIAIIDPLTRGIFQRTRNYCIKLEKLLRLENEKAVNLGLSPLNQTELDRMIEESENDIQKENVLTHQAVKQTVLNWRTSKK